MSEKKSLLLRVFTGLAILSYIYFWFTAGSFIVWFTPLHTGLIIGAVIFAVVFLLSLTKNNRIPKNLQYPFIVAALIYSILVVYFAYDVVSRIAF